MAQPVEQENLTYNSQDGGLFGATSTKKIAFYGATPVSRPVTASTNSVSTATTISMSSAGSAIEIWGFSTQAEILNYTVAVSSMQLAMRNLGLIS